MESPLWLGRLEEALFHALAPTYALAALALWLATRRGRRWRQAGMGLALLGLTVHLADLVIRGMRVGRLPTGDFYEFGLLFALGAVGVYLVMDARCFRRGVDLAGAGAITLAFTCALLAFVRYALPQDYQAAAPLPPVLHSYWRAIHVLAAVPGYGACVVAFALAVLYLARRRESSDRRKAGSPSSETLEKLTYQLIAFAAPFLTLLNVSGAIWAVQSWGRYWAWDQKEVWSLATWLVYIGYLHARRSPNWRGEGTACLCVIGFGVLMITLLGVNFLPVFGHSIHSYAGTGR